MYGSDFVERPAASGSRGFLEGEQESCDHDWEENVIPDCGEELENGLNKVVGGTDKFLWSKNCEMADTHSCEDEGYHEDQMRCKDYKEVDGGILDDRSYDRWSRYGCCGGV